MAGTYCQGQTEDDKMSSEENKKISILFHERNLEDIDDILTDNFIGSYWYTEPEANKWDKESHRNALKTYSDFKDSILLQIAEGDMVATRFIRSGPYEGILVKAEIMQFTQFEDGKIIRSWEIMGPMQEISEIVQVEK